MSEELKACPFCRSIAARAFKAWNTRVESEELKKVAQRRREDRNLALKQVREMEKEKAELIEWLELVKKDIEGAFKGKFPFDEICSDTHSGIEEKLYKLKGGEG